MGEVIGCHSVQAWIQQLETGIQSNKLVVVDFTATWCGPCRMVAPLFAELAKNLPDVMFLKVDVDELESVAAEYNVEAMPTFILLKEGKIVERIVGVKKDKLEQTIVQHMTTATA